MTALSYREYGNSSFLELLVSINRTIWSHVTENGDAKMHRRRGLETSNKSIKKQWFTLYSYQPYKSKVLDT